MPIFQYQCKNCGFIEERIEKYEKEYNRKCPKCGENGLERLLGAPSLHFKGNGFYKTDYERKKEKDNTE